MDAVFERSTGAGVPLSMEPSEYFKRQCFISADPDETAAPLIVEHVGADRFMWASDYPHPDHPHTWVPDLVRFVEPLGEEARRLVLGDNVESIYRLSG